MASYYFDTSALAKRYVVEIGSSWVQAVVAHQSGQTICTSVLTHLKYLHISGRNHCWKKGFHPFGRHTTGEIGS